MRRTEVMVVAVLLGVVNVLPPALPAEQARAAVPHDSTKESLLGSFSIGDRHQPISVDAGALEFSYKDQVLTYTGGVVVTQGDLTLRSDKLTVTFADSAADRLKEVVAEGDVTISKGTRSAAGGRAVFNQKDRTVELTEHAVLMDGPNKVNGGRVVVYLDEERAVVEGGDQRVQAWLFPDQGLPAPDKSDEKAGQ